MKKAAILLLCCLLVCLLVAGGALADGVTEDGLVYHISTQAYAIIDDYQGEGGTVTIPASIEGYPVGYVGFSTASGSKVNHPEITVIDLTACDRLYGIDCAYTSVTSLDVSKNLNLDRISCGNTRITSLDLTNNPKMDMLDCYETPISKLVLTNNPKLSMLNCWNCQITELNLSNNPELEMLSCSNNPISSLDVTRNTKLYYLSFGNTEIATIDLSNNVKLRVLTCEKTQITTLDISYNHSLESVYCSDTIVNIQATSYPNLVSFCGPAEFVFSLDLFNYPSLKDIGVYVKTSSKSSDGSKYIYDLNNISGFDTSRATDWDCETDGDILLFEEEWNGKSWVSCKYRLDDGKVMDLTLEISLDRASPLPADTTHDGSITLDDILPYMNGTADVDANGDGVNNVADAVHVLKYLCGYGVTLE